MNEKEELINQIKNYFGNKANLEVIPAGCCPDDEFSIIGEVKLNEDEFKEFHEFLKELGFLQYDTFTYQVADKKYYKRYYCDEDFKTEDDNSIRLSVSCIKVIEEGKTTYYIKNIGIAFKKKKKK